MRPVRQATKSDSEPPELLWIDCSYPPLATGLTKILENEMRVHAGRKAPPEENSSFVLLGAKGVEDLSEGMKRVGNASPSAPITTFSISPLFAVFYK